MSCRRYSADGHTAHKWSGTEFVDGDVVAAFGGHHHGNLFHGEFEQFRVGNFGADPAFVPDYVLAASAEHDFVVSGDSDILARFVDDIAGHSRPFHEHASPEAGYVFLDFSYGAGLVEEVAFGLIGAENNRAQSVDVCRVGCQWTLVHALFQLLGLLSHFLYASEHGGAYVGQNICRAYGAENVGNGIAHRHDVEPVLFVGSRGGECAYGVVADADYRRHGLRAGEKSGSLTGIVAEEQRHARGYGEA